MHKEKFVYVIYIQSTPEKVWQALTDGEQTREYWGRHRNASDWNDGSRWEHQDYNDANVVDIAGTVLESARPSRLVVSWHLPGDENRPDKISRVTYSIEPFEDATRLTVTHEDLEPASDMLYGVTQGWPAVLSSLKTFLETGQAMPMLRRRWEAPPD
ncbi:MAG TPA: SRPBCC family protein [Thermoanaerobaculia bacterium]|nr:SRPBCC family protein [Thermoanaerobaculia bacterium]